MNDNEHNNPINDLIEYSDSGEDTPQGELPVIEEIISEEAEEEIIYYISDEEYTEQNQTEARNVEAIEEIDVPEYIKENISNKKTKKKESGTFLGAIIGIVAGIALIIAFISIDSGIIGTYKRNFAVNFSHIFANFATEKNTSSRTEKKETAVAYKNRIKSSIIVAPDNMADSAIIPFKEGVLCAAENHMSYINTSGETIWETNTAVVDPLIAAEGNYILLAEKGRNKLCLYADKKLLYDVDDADNIMAVKVSARGDAVAVTDKSSYRGGISVYNRSGEQIYSWASGHDTVISADIASASRRVAVALLNTEVKAKSVIQMFDINQSQSYSQINIDDTIIYNVEFSGSMLTAFGDNRLVTFTDGGRVITDIMLEDNSLIHSAMDSVGNKLLSFDDGNSSVLRIFNRRGAQKDSITTDTAPDFTDINGKYIIYSLGRDIYFGKAGSANLTKYTATMDIKSLILLSDEIYIIVYSNSFEIIEV